MPDTATLDRPAAQGTGGSLLHLVCCDDDLALCGEDVSGEDWADKGNVCVPCEIEWALGGPCPVTGCGRRGLLKQRGEAITREDAHDRIG